MQNALLDALPIAVTGMQARHIVLANHAVEDVFGWKPEELIGRSTRVLYRSAEDYEQIGKSVYRALKKHRTFKTEFPCRRKGGKNIICMVSVARIGESLQDERIIAKDGSVKWIQETVNAITFKGKRAVLGNSMDITAKSEEAEKLREFLALQNALLDALPIAVMGMHARRIVLANHAVEDVFGWKPEELIGRGTRVLYRSDEDYEQVGKSVYKVLKKQRTFKTEFPCRRKGGKNIVCLVSVARIGESLQDDRIIATYEDITERKRAEKALEESERTLKALLRTYQNK
jgi:PAS domain S-box-containing protein